MTIELLVYRQTPVAPRPAPAGLHRYTPAQIAFIEANLRGRPYAELTAMFNARFGTSLTSIKVQMAANNRGLFNGLTGGQFKPGQIPANKGKKIWWDPGGSAATRFKNGNIPANHRPVGSERVNVDGYTELKTAEPNKWRMKHVVVWEAAHGPVPEGHIVTFGDGDKSNFGLDNLILITRGQHAVMNKHGLKFNDAGLTATGALIADVMMKASARRRQLQDTIKT